MEDSKPKVINTHHFGGPTKLPDNAKYIGRPSPHGNPYSSKSGKYTREECVALHRIDLYRSLRLDPLGFARLKDDLGGYDLACWCKQPKKIVGCHGDNFLHVLSPLWINRTYTKPITSYLMEDLRYILNRFETWLRTDIAQDHYLMMYIHFHDVKLYTQYILAIVSEAYVNEDDLNFFLAALVIDLELGFQDPDMAMMKYRFDHAFWVLDQFMTNRHDRDREPQPPKPQLIKKRKEVSAV